MREPRFQWALSSGSLLIALTLLGLGLGRVHTVFTDPALMGLAPSVPGPGPGDPSLPWAPPELLLPPPEPKAYRVRDWRMIENATFTGVTRVEEGFFFTYDPTQPRGKRSCPT